MKNIATLVAIILVTACWVTISVGAPFAKTIQYAQPDGTAIELWGEGDEFYAVFETLDGYTVVFDPLFEAYVYATLSADSAEFVPTDLLVGAGDPSARGLKRHVRMSPDAVRAQAQSRYEAWDQSTQNSTRWNERKAAMHAAERAAAGSPVALAPPASTTTGNKVGLCLLIDFADDPATVPQAEIVNFLNGDSYTGNDNNGSVKKYFLDNSNNLLTYTNVVVAYIRMYYYKYNYMTYSQDAIVNGNALIYDAISILKALPNYATQIAPRFANLTTVGSSGYLAACNVFYAGGSGGVWAQGLWQHSSTLQYVGPQTLVAGKTVYYYQITPIGTALELGTFCHENGHMLCGYPDIYDYGQDSVGGAGLFCLMGSGGHGTNPSQICAYLKRAAGWTSTVELSSGSSLIATLASSGANFNRIYRYAKPGVSTEYYLAENRQAAGRDANLPASGIAIWHIDELGNKDNQSLAYNTNHDNYECTLVQADNLWHFQNYVNHGDAQDLFYSGNAASGYANAFSDATAPCARWWDGSTSGIRFGSFSASGTTMTFSVGTVGLSVLTSSPLPAGCVGVTYSQALAALGGTAPYTWAVVSNALPSGLGLSGGVITGNPDVAGTTVFKVRATDAASATATATLSLTINPAQVVFFSETFENAGSMPNGWTQEYVANATSWAFQNGGDSSEPTSAHGGSYNACLFFDDTVSQVTKLVSPAINLGAVAANAQLTFWHCMKKWGSDQDELRVYYKTASGGVWTLLAAYTDEVSAWTQRTLTLPSPSRTYYFAFEGCAKYGYGVCVDDVAVMGSATPYWTWQTGRFTEAELAAGLICGDNADPDHDGIANLLEYAMGLNPRLADTVGLPAGGVLNWYLTLNYRQNKQATDVVYAVESCTNLLTGGWTTNNVTRVSSVDSNLWWSVTTRHTVPVTNAPSRYMRLKVNVP